MKMCISHSSMAEHLSILPHIITKSSLMIEDLDKESQLTPSLYPKQLKT
jgi:hypothetical protein